MIVQHQKEIVGYSITTNDAFQNCGKYIEEIYNKIKNEFKDLSKACYYFVCLEMFFNPKAPTHKYKVLIAPNTDNLPQIQGLKISTIKGGKYATMIHKGPYVNIAPKYKQLTEEIKNSNLHICGFPFEQYLNDPSIVKEEDLETLIAFPVSNHNMIRTVVIGGVLIAAVAVAFKLMK
uniref:Transcription activator effector binding n=1 Tax=Trepomonas sp. PC1 TaxID=1076344 RepID=A0A146K2P3_9EUKA|eukprot:JAP91162.1 Transcription activator effector binding [Trepomonas sp. PC1]